ncbi:MAG TPA: hypothetical protein VMR25_00050 [Planctomycetaceae bacterium]|nr:hypothetical protein [Planctomycetaceae bacterium]
MTAAHTTPTFALSTSSTEIGAPQIWNIEHDGTLSGDVTVDASCLMRAKKNARAIAGRFDVLNDGSA